VTDDPTRAPALPTPYPRPGLPSAVRIVEVGPRDGLQAEAAIVPTAAKIEFVDRLAGCGLEAIEVTSFVSPRRVPQLADATEVLSGVGASTGRRLVLVPNLRGYERLIESEPSSTLAPTEVAVFVSATETFAQANLGTDRATAITNAGEVINRAVAEGRRVRGYVSMCFGDPWEGAVDPAVVGEVAGLLVELGCHTVSLGDTIGVGTAGQVPMVVTACATAGLALDRIALHFHDTYGQALANVLAGLEAGVTEFDSAAGGLGGCPFAKSATGNLATEDLVWFLRGLGLDTGVDLERLAATSAWMAGLLGRPMPSAVARAVTGAVPG